MNELYQTFSVLSSEDVSLEEIIDFIAENANLPREVVRERIRLFLSGKKKKSFLSYKVFEKKEREERSYFLKLSRRKSIPELAEVFAEMAIMLERALIMNAYYIWKIKELEKKLEYQKSKEEEKGDGSYHQEKARLA